MNPHTASVSEICVYEFYVNGLNSEPWRLFANGETTGPSPLPEGTFMANHARALIDCLRSAP